jgi:hypothetical protein
MTKAVFPRGLPEKSRHQHGSQGVARPIGALVCRTPTHGLSLSCAFYRHAQLVPTGAGDYSVSPKVAAVPRRNPWPL